MANGIRNARMSTCDLPVPGFPKRRRYFCQLESEAAGWLSSNTEDWREERAAVMSASMAV